jgi:hypothetical protein
MFVLMIERNERKKRLNVLIAWPPRRGSQGKVGKKVQEVGTSPNGTDGTAG